MQFVVPFSNGVDRSNDEARLAEGFARVITNAIYLPDDPDRLFKIPGRTNALTLGGSETPFGLRHLQFDYTTNQIVCLKSPSNPAVNTFFYYQNEGTTLSTWAALSDQAVSPAAYITTGTWLKAINTGDNRWILFTGATNARNLIIDSDYYTRYLGLRAPLAPTIATVTSVLVTTGATVNAASTGTAVLDGITRILSGTGFSNPTQAYDGSTTSFAELSVNTLVTSGSTFSSFTAGAVGSQIINVSLSASGANTSGTVGSTGGRGGGIGGRVYVQMTGDVTAGTPTWVTVWSGDTPFERRSVSYPAASLSPTDMNKVGVRVLGRVSVAGGNLVCDLYEISTSTGGSAAVLPDGAFYYCYTELYNCKTVSGESTIIESPPSAVVVATFSGNTTVTGVTLTFPATPSNVAADGVLNTANHILSRRIYRTTRSGVFPDMGAIQDLPLGTLSWTDTFATGPTVLSSTPLRVVYDITGFPVRLDDPPPAFYDATITRQGALLVIDSTQTRIKWSLPGFLESFPFLQDIKLANTERKDQLRGVASIGDAVLLFSRSSVHRLVNIPYLTLPPFDVNRLIIDTISPTEGLAGTPLSYCTFTTQDGRGAIAWVSDNGIWMTDGTLLSERGMGVHKLSINIDWYQDVNTTRLMETQLTFDPVLQMIYFDYYNWAGTRQTVTLHTHPAHWVDTGQDMSVPKITGPHSITAPIARTVGEFASTGSFYHWALTANAILNERQGYLDNGANITTTIQSGWVYPASGIEEFDIFWAGIYHNDWSGRTGVTGTITTTADLEIKARRDQTGIIQTLTKAGLVLTSAGTTRAFAHVSGQSFRFTITNVGASFPPIGTSQSPLAFGPVIIDGDPMGELERD